MPGTARALISRLASSTEFELHGETHEFLHPLAPGLAHDRTGIVDDGTGDDLGPVRRQLDGNDAADRRTDDDDIRDSLGGQEFEDVIAEFRECVVPPVGVVVRPPMPPPVHAQHATLIHEMIGKFLEHPRVLGRPRETKDRCLVRMRVGVVTIVEAEPIARAEAFFDEPGHPSP